MINTSPVVLPKLAKQEVSIRNQIYTYRHILSFGNQVIVQVTTENNNCEEIETTILISGLNATLAIEESLINIILKFNNIDTTWSELPESYYIRTCIISSILYPCISFIKQQYNIDIIFNSKANKKKYNLKIPFLISLQGNKHYFSINTTLKQANKIINIINNILTIKSDHKHLKVPFNIQQVFSRKRILLKELQLLEYGDFIKILGPDDDKNICNLYIDNIPFAQGIIEHDTNIKIIKVLSMADTDQPNPANQNKNHIDPENILVDVDFILGKTKISLEQLQKITPGHILEINKTLDNSIDIYANGRPIAIGDLVQIEEHIGVVIKKIL